jgi:hypothetical protein
MQLKDLQRSFQSHLLSGENTVLPQILAAPPLSPAARLEIYRAAYVNRLIEALRATYLKIHQILGDEVFASMASEFVSANASTTRSIRWYGGQLPAFLARTAPYADQPVLSELARFEWALAEVFDAADAQTLTRAAIARVDPSLWGNLRLKFHASVRTVNFDWNAIAVWQAIDAAEQVPAPEKSARGITWLLWRHDLKNYFRSLDPVEQTALAWAMDGASFSIICDELRHRLPEEQIPLRAASLVALWADSGILVEPLEPENMG